MNRTATWIPAYGLTAAIWGSSFLFIMVSLRGFTPIQVGFGRMLLGAASLWLLTAILRSPLPRGRAAYFHLFVLALLLNSIPGILFAYAETYISSILASIMNASTPLFGMIAMLTIFREQKPTAAQQRGLLIGFAGVLTVLGVWEGVGRSTLIGIGACAIAVFLYGISFPYGRRYVTPMKLSPMSAVAVQITMGVVQGLPVVLLEHRLPDFRSDAVLALIALGTLGSGIAFVLNQYVINTVGAVKASTVTYWTPLVATVVGVTVLGEKLRWFEPVGAVVVLVGVLVAQEKLRLSRRRG